MFDDIYQDAFDDELEKIARNESAYDPDVRKEFIATSRKGQWYPAIGMLGGISAGMMPMKKIIDSIKIPWKAKLPLSLALPAVGAVAGIAGAAKLQTMKRDKFVKSMPKDNKFRRIYLKNRVGAGKAEMKEFGDAYNENIKSGKPLSKKHQTMRKLLIGDVSKKKS